MRRLVSKSPSVRTPQIAPVRRSRSLPAPRLPTAAALGPDWLQTGSYYIGQSIIYFTAIYTTLNWWYYRDLHKRVEAAEKAREEERQAQKERMSRLRPPPTAAPEEDSLDM